MGHTGRVRRSARGDDRSIRTPLAIRSFRL
jgi:hypothetical protein